MVAALHFSQDLRLLNHREEVIVDQEVIEPLADVALSITVLDPPPSVLSDFLVQLPKSISPAQLEEVPEALAFDVGEARVLVSHHRHVDVDLLMTNVHVSTDYHTLSFGLQLLAVLVKGLLV